MPQYTSDSVFEVLENLCSAAEVKVVYTTVPDDSSKGELWARADEQATKRGCLRSPALNIG